MITYLLIMLFMFFICYVTCVIISFTIFMAVIVTLIIAMGFVLQPNSYLRDAWNIVSKISLILTDIVA